MPALPDIVRDSKLDTRFHRGDTVHSYIEPALNRRRRSRQESWKRERDLGQGSYGRVLREKCTAGGSKGALRAVKMILKSSNPTHTLDYHRELEVVAKFSHRRVSHE